MNFKHYIQLCEEPLPGVGLYRSYRDTYRNMKSYQKAKSRRDEFCFKHELKKRCSIYKEYKHECYKMNQVRHILCNRFPEDVVKYLLGFYSVEKKEFIPRTNYYCITTNDKYKWYILISNILHTMKPQYHQNVLNIYKKLKPYHYDENFKTFLKYMGKEPDLLQSGLTLHFESETVFDIADQYKKHLNDHLYYMYYNIRL